MKRYWIVKYTWNGFELPLFLYGTESEMQDYCQSELGRIPAYSGATDAQVEAGRALRMKFYIV